MSRTSWKPQRLLGSAALACALVITSAVPALGAVPSSPVVPAAATHSTALVPGAPPVDGSVPQPVLAASTPRISGTARVGQKLTATVGYWTPGTKHTYQWYREGQPITGATAKTYTTKVHDLGKTLTVRVTGTQAGYATKTVTSAVFGPIKTGVLPAPTPKIPAAPKVGQKLTASVGTWAVGTALTYQWYRNGAAIKGATAKGYTAVAADWGKALTVKVTGSQKGYATTTVTSAKSRAVAAGTLRSAVPKISGTAKAGKKLAVDRGSWTSGTKLTQRWFRNGAAISGATGTSYTLKSTDAGTTITVKVTGSKAGYTTVAKTSAGVRVQAAPKPAAKPKPQPVSNRAAPRGKSCPSSHPIKGNADSGIYHVPSGAFYGRTVPEACFTTEAAAKAAGYRKSKR
ncbi:MAG: hypothetical protein QJR09_01530 [Micrococcus sp.]|nr:hypothetical protein [Micrococcus sp.]